VLAVGGAQFQRKCLGKLKSVGRSSGRTILFVSHNMAAVRSICTKGLLLERGVAVLQGEIDEVVDGYLSSDPQSNTYVESIETASFFLDSVRIESLSGSVIKTFDPVKILVTFTPKEDIGDFGLYIGILSGDEQRLTGVDLADFTTLGPIPAGRQATIGFEIASLPLLGGNYRLDVHLKDLAVPKYEFVEGAFPFEVAETPVGCAEEAELVHQPLGVQRPALPARADERDRRLVQILDEAFVAREEERLIPPDRTADRSHRLRNRAAGPDKLQAKIDVAGSGPVRDASLVQQLRPRRVHELGPSRIVGRRDEADLGAGHAGGCGQRCGRRPPRVRGADPPGPRVLPRGGFLFVAIGARRVADCVARRP